MLLGLPPRGAAAVRRRPAGGAHRRRTLRRSAGELSARYRSAGAAGPAARSDDEIAAYAATRLPATYAAVAVALDELARAGVAPASHLDLGTGLGSAVWAAGAAFGDSLQRVTAVDAVDGMLQVASAAAVTARFAAVRRAEWRRADVARSIPDGSFDLVTASYLLNELEPAAALALLSRAWSQTTGALVLVEPGTPADYDRMMAFRGHLIERGATILAPCPHDRPCPMRDDWCHFAVRPAALGRAPGGQGREARVRGREVHVPRRGARRGPGPRRSPDPPAPARATGPHPVPALRAGGRAARADGGA